MSVNKVILIGNVGKDGSSKAKELPGVTKLKRDIR